MFSFLLFTLALAALALGRAAAPGPDAVLLRNIQALSLNNIAMTRGHRTRPQAQMRCIGGTGAHYASLVTAAQCVNRGHDGREQQWRCEATMPAGLSFGRVRISCEGYNAPGDAYVLEGSCALRYELNGAPQQSGRTVPPDAAAKRGDGTSARAQPQGADLGLVALAVLAYMGIMIVVLIIGYFLWSRQQQPRGGGGGTDVYVDPPVLPITRPHQQTHTDDRFVDGFLWASLLHDDADDAHEQVAYAGTETR